MAVQLWQPLDGDEFEDYMMVAKNLGNAYLAIVAWVADQKVLTDDRAIQAAAATIAIKADKIFSNPNLIFRAPKFDTAEEGFAMLPIYLQVTGQSYVDGFVDLAAQLVQELADGVEMSLKEAQEQIRVQLNYLRVNYDLTPAKLAKLRPWPFAQAVAAMSLGGSLGESRVKNLFQAANFVIE